MPPTCESWFSTTEYTSGIPPAPELWTRCVTSMMESKKPSSWQVCPPDMGPMCKTRPSHYIAQPTGERGEEKKRKRVDSSTEDDLPHYRDPPPSPSDYILWFLTSLVGHRCVFNGKTASVDVVLRAISMEGLIHIRGEKTQNSKWNIWRKNIGSNFINCSYTRN